MYTEIIGTLNGTGKRFALVVSRFNDFITSRLLEGALDCFARHGGAEEDLTVVRVPGAFEIPLTAAKLAKQGHYDAVICLGAVIRGSTPPLRLCGCGGLQGDSPGGAGIGGAGDLRGPDHGHH